MMNEISTDVNKNTVETNKAFSNTGKILIGVTGGIAIGLSIISASFVSPGFRKICLPYVPATDTQIRNVILALKNKKGKLIDLGSGDGRIVIESAKHNFEAHGVELNPWLVFYSKIDALRHRKNYSIKPSFFRSDLWKFDISQYNNIVIFGVEEMMTELEKKIQNEVQENATIIACRFPLPNYKSIATIGSGVDTVWVYSKK